MNYLFCRTCPCFTAWRDDVLEDHEDHIGIAIDVPDDKDVAQVFARWLDFRLRYERDRFGLDALNDGTGCAS